MKLKVILILISMIVQQNGKRTDCHWFREFLCGDKCLNNQYYCFCGNDIIDYSGSLNHTCCNSETCTKNNLEPGNVYCNGTKQKWEDTCDGKCLQHSTYGYNNLLCDDHINCYLEVNACFGKPLCAE